MLRARGKGTSDFEYFFSFFGLLLGLTVAEVAVHLADAIEPYRKRPISLLTPSAGWCT